MPKNHRANFPKISRYFCTALLLLLTVDPTLSANEKPAGNAESHPRIALYAFCGTGDNLWNHKVEPVDSRATIDAMCEWMAKTYGIKRIYWRGAQEEFWRKYFREGDYHTPTEDWNKWKHYLYGELDINAAAVKAAKANGMEIFMYTGIFDFGVQPDVGIINPHLYEDTLRIQNPQWCPLDRWGQRRSPGPICFGYPEARKIAIDRLVKEILTFGYDGVNFYTYVENQGIRYEDEFGFNRPILEEFQKRYPGVDLRTATLTPEQKIHWYECRGKFVTVFLAELHAKLQPHGKKLSMILDAAEPDYAQKWWGKKLHGAGKISMDWKNWIKQGIVDEIWVQLGDVQDQQNLLDLLLAECKGTPVKLTVRAVDPLSPTWEPYVERGVTPVAVITWEKNGIERISLEPTSVETLKSPDWKLRAQTLADIALKKLAAPAKDVCPLADDREVLVRHRSMKALSTLGGDEAISTLENSLGDPESSVRIASADALIKTHGPHSAQRIIDQLGKGEVFQFKLVAASALSAMAPGALPEILEGLNSPHADVREVCVQTLRGPMCVPGQRARIYQALRKIMLDPKEDPVVRSWAIDRLTGGYADFSAELPANQATLVADLLSLFGSNTPPNVELRSAERLKIMAPFMTPAQKTAALDGLEKFFRQYGDKSNRPDSAYGWRLVGNTMLSLQGKDRLETMRQQKEDKWLAWNAYETVYLFQDLVIKDKVYVFNEVDEKQAIEEHEKYAPEFPGWRKW